MSVSGRSSGRSQEVAFGKIAGDLQKAAFQFGAMVASARQLYSAINVFRDLNKQLTLTAAIANATTTEFKQMENAVRSFALGTTFTASQSSNALLVLSQAGFSVQQSMSAMSGVLTLAQATLEDVNAAADLVASTLTSFKLEAEDASRVSNLFAASMNQSLASLPKLQYALRQVGPVAGAMGITIEETTAALSELFNVGLRGEQAGTALRNVMVNLIAPAGEAAKILRTLGVQTRDAHGQLRTLTAILKDLSRFNLSDTDLANLFGKEAMAGGIALLNSAASGSLQKMEKEISGTQEAVRVALEQMHSLDATIVQAQNAVDEFRLAFGAEFEGAIKSAMNWVTDLSLAYRNLDAGTKAYITSLASTTAALAVGIPVLTKTVGLLGSFASGAVTLAGDLRKSAGGISEMVSGMRLLADQSPLVSQLGRIEIAGGFVKALPVIGAVTTAIVGVGGLVWAFYEAKRAAQQASLGEVLGSYDEMAESISRNIKNLGQITASSDDFKNLDALADQFKLVGASIDDAQKSMKEIEVKLASLDGIGEQLEAASRESNKVMGSMMRQLAHHGADRIGGVLSALQISATASIDDKVKGIEDAYRKQFQPVLDLIGQIGPEHAAKAEMIFDRALADGEVRKKILEGKAEQLIGLYSNASQAALNSAVGHERGALDNIRTRLNEEIKKRQDDIKELEDIAFSGDIVTSQRRFTEAFVKKQTDDIVNILKSTDISEDDARRILDEGGIYKGKMTALATKVFKQVFSGSIDWDKAAKDSIAIGSEVSGKDLELIRQAATETAERRLSVITSEAMGTLEAELRKAEKGKAKADTAAAAAKGDKGAQLALKRIEQYEIVASEIMDFASKSAKAIENRMGDMAMKGSAFSDVITGRWIADLLQTGDASEYELAVKAINDAEFRNREIERRLTEVFARESFDRVLSEVAGKAVEDVDASALFKPMYALYEAAEGGKDVFDATQTALNEVEGFLRENIGLASAILKAANVGIESLNNEEQAKLAASKIVFLNGGELASVADQSIRDQVIDALSSTDSFLTKANNVVKALWNKASAIISNSLAVAKGGIFSQAKELATNNLNDEGLKGYDKVLQDYLTAIKAKSDANIAATQDRLAKDSGKKAKGAKKGGGGKSKEQQKAELDSFLAERNKSIIDSMLELATFGENYNIDEIIDLRIKAIDADYSAQIEKATKEYEKMFSRVEKGSSDHAKLIEMRDKELEQLQKLKDKNLEYANSAEFAARVQHEAAQQVLDKYIEMNTYTGSFLQGLQAGMQQQILGMTTAFEQGMDTMKQLVDGFVGFGNDMFAGFFEQVATGQKSMGDLLKETLRKMLMQWAKYFADLAFKYMADWMMKQVMGIVGGAFGGGGGMGLGYFPPAPKAFANGGAYDVKQFAAGGVVDRPSFFGYGKEHNIGQRGEAGQEGVLPLKRNAQGKLGVIAIGDDNYSSSGSTLTLTNQTVINMPTSGESDDEREMRLMQRISSRQKEVALEVIAEESRVGGILYNNGGR